MAANAWPKSRIRAESLRIFLIILPCFICTWTAFDRMLNFSHNQHKYSTQSDVPIVSILHRPLSYKTKPSRQKYTGNITDCLYYNSKSWLEGPRLGNLNVTTVDDRDKFLSSAMLGLSTQDDTRSILEQSICHKDSKFTDTDKRSDSAVELWTTRLMYLSIHAHQHRPAMLEAQARYRNQETCAAQLQKHNIGIYDYECPSAKFLVVALSNSGIGANMRLGAVSALKAGIASNRTVLFVNNAPTGPAFLQEPWSLTSCERRDYQCFFFPSSPCVLTHSELDNAYQMTKAEKRQLLRRGTVPQEHNHRRVLAMQLKFRPQRSPETLRPILYNLSASLLNTELATLDPALHSKLEKAAKRILQEDELPTQTYSYYGANSQLHNALLLYAMRPNPQSERDMDRILQEILPNDFEPNQAIGLPIRASDKCGKESECLSFAQYMKAAAKRWKGHGPASNQHLPSVIVTTESPSVLREQEEYAASEPGGLDFPVRFILNHRDVAQDTGFVMKRRSNATADEAMISALSSLKAQLHSRVTLGNCCSNFHLLLADLLAEGCGASPENHFLCLQDHEDPEFRICCAWDKTEECQRRRNQTAVLESKLAEFEMH